jgi:ADP-ribose pyrophosphatase
MTQIETLFNGKYLRLMRKGSWEYAERTTVGGAVIVIAVTGDDCIVFVEQFRIPVNARTIEMPAGIVGDIAGLEHEGALETAKRELLEETGYRAARAEFIMEGPTSAGMSNETIAFVRAYDLVREHAGGGDATEDITVHEIPRSDAARWLWQKMDEGYSMDPKLFAGLYFLEHGGMRKSGA